MPPISIPAFPTFLLPSLPFPQRQHKASQGHGSVDDSVEEVGFLHSSESNSRRSSHLSYIRCGRCGSHICHTSQIISKGFTGRHGRAFLVSPADITSLDGHNQINTTTTLPNTITQRPVPRQLVTGAHTVADINCILCGSVLGWKYIAAEEEAQRYKVGKYIIETKRVTNSSCWEFQEDFPASASPESASSLPGAADNDEYEDYSEVEFDSQDEDECEDLFAGVWSPGLARRRRSLKLTRKA